MSESERFHTDIERSWRYFRIYWVGAIIVGVIHILYYYFPAVPITTEINPVYIEILATLTGIVFAMISLFIFRPSLLIKRHRLMMMVNCSLTLSALGLFSYYFAVGRIPRVEAQGEREAISVIFFLFDMALYTLTFLIYTALGYQAKIEKTRGYVEP